ncbi:unnamed protein product [Agarophyton chilense]
MVSHPTSDPDALAKVDSRKGCVEFVNLVATATLPSPARQGRLRLNPFMDKGRKRFFRIPGYTSRGDCHRVMTNQSSEVFPARLPVRTNWSVTITGDSTWSYNPEDLITEDAENKMDGLGELSDKIIGKGKECHQADKEPRKRIPLLSKENDQNAFPSDNCDEITPALVSPHAVQYFGSSQARKPLAECVEIRMEADITAKDKGLSYVQKPKNESERSPAAPAKNSFVRKSWTKLKRMLAVWRKGANKLFHCDQKNGE